MATGDTIDLGNWREPPFNRTSFTRVRELIPTASIPAGPGPVQPLPRAFTDLARLNFRSPAGGETTLAAFLDATLTDAFMVLQRGTVIYEWYRNAETALQPHIVFSVSKSMTAALCGILEAEGQLDAEAPVIRYVPELENSAYADAKLRHVLDMTVSLQFNEAYLNPDETFLRYREASGWNKRRPGAELTLHTFLPSLRKSEHPHGERFHYRSPNSDLLGWIIERASGRRFHELFTERIWQSMAAQSDAYITLDPAGAPRTAGGICVTIADLARFGEMVRCRGVANGRQVLPGKWVEEIMTAGSIEQWQRGDMLNMLSVCRYRSKWYTRVDVPHTMAIGIHGQWLVIDPSADLVIAKQSSHALPSDDATDHLHFAAFEAIAERVRHG